MIFDHLIVSKLNVLLCIDDQSMFVPNLEPAYKRKLRDTASYLFILYTLISGAGVLEKYFRTNPDVQKTFLDCLNLASGK